MPLAPEYQAFFAQLAETPGPSFTQMTPAEGRAAYRLMRPLNPELAVSSVSEQSVPGSAGQIGLRVYRPEGPGPFPLYVNFHGGGWVIGDLDTADAACRDLCATAGCVVVSVDYRLAPENRYPAAVDDCYEATCWAAENSQNLEGNGKLAVGGESAGGNLAAAVCLRARDEAGPEIDFQLLLYPVTDADFTRQSYVDNAAGYLLETETMKWFWDHYLPDAKRRDEPYASPIRAADLSNLPPALVVTAEFDPLRDEGMAFAQALQNAGTPADAVCYDGLVHDFFATAQLFEASRAPFQQVCARLRQALAG